MEFTNYKEWFDALPFEQQEAIRAARQGNVEDGIDDLAEKGNYGGDPGKLPL